MKQYIVPDEGLNAEAFPNLYNLSSAFWYRFIPVPDGERPAPEYAYVPLSRRKGSVHLTGAIAQYNWAWESGHLRSQWREEDWPAELAWINGVEDVDLRLVPRVRQHRYDAFAPLYHLLPANTLRRFGLPLLKQGMWPSINHDWDLDKLLPADVDTRLSAALSYHLWPYLESGSAPSAFAPDEPVRVLSHNLDFWLPYIDRVIQWRLSHKARCEPDDPEQAAALERARRDVPDGIQVVRPLQGGDIWYGEEDAADATEHMVELADEGGRLRGIIDAVRSNRVEDDFSDRWSFAREDFERKLHRKRLKTRVRFVELDDTVPVHGPDSEIHEKLLWEDFVAFLDQKERKIVVLLRSGFTRVGEIADQLGYANHSPVSKALTRIRQKAIRYLEMD